MKALHHLALATTLVAAAGAHHRADACVVGNVAEVITYFQDSQPFGTTDDRCDFTGQCRLQGWLIKPATGNNLPAIVLLHGSGDLGDDKQELGEFCEAENWFVDRGYVVFMPFRRGVRDITPSSRPGAGFQNTGLALADFVNDVKENDTTYENDFWSSVYMQEETNDIQNAITTLVGRARNGAPLVNKNRIAIMGHSYGGAIAALASNVSYVPLPRAVVSLSGAAMSWHESTVWHDDLDFAVEFHQEPIFFQRVLNEAPPPLVDFASANDQFNAASSGWGTGEVARARWPSITPSADYQHACDTASPPTPEFHCVHGSFVQEKQNVDIWIGDVHDFLTRHGV